MEQSTSNQIIDSLKMDVDELNSFEQSKIQKQLNQQQAEENKKIDQSGDSTLYQKITDYAWDQEGKKIKIYLKLLEVGQVASENIIWSCTPTSIDLKIRGCQGKNLRFGVGKLFDSIDPQESKYLVKSNAINLTLMKKDHKHWDALPFKEQTIKPPGPKKGGEEDQDPQASLMNMMKDLYNSGDTEMKRTIAQAWQKSQDDKDKTKKEDFM